MTAAEYPTLFSLYDKDELREGFHEAFRSGGELCRSFYIDGDKLCLIAGQYKGYTADIDSPYEGERPFIIELSMNQN